MQSLFKLSWPVPNWYPRFFRLAWVNVLSNLLVPLAGLIDVAFLGHLAEIRHLAGVALATVLFNYLYWSFGFLRMGTTGTTAQAMGRGDREAVLITGLRHALLAIGIGLAIVWLQAPLRSLGFSLLSATADVKAAGQAYYSALVWGAPATLLNFVWIGWFLGQGQGGRVLLLSAISNGANIGLDYLLIVQWGWGSAGAGGATAISQYLSAAAGLVWVLRELNWQQVRSLIPRLWEPTALTAVFALNGNILIRTLALISTFALFTNLSSSFGPVALATNALLLQVVTLSAYFVDGLAFATESLTGWLQGQNAKAQLWQLVKLAGVTGVVLGLGIALLFITWPLQLFSRLTHHREVLEQVTQYVFWLLPVLGLGAIAYVLDGYFLGLTAGKILRQSTITAVLVGFLPLAIASWHWQSSHLLWLALAMFMGMRSLTLALYLPSTLKPEDDINLSGVPPESDEPISIP